MAKVKFVNANDAITGHQSSGRFSQLSLSGFSSFHPGVVNLSWRTFHFLKLLNLGNCDSLCRKAVYVLSFDSKFSEEVIS